MRGPTNLGTEGQAEGLAETVYHAVWIDLEQLAGTQVERARALWPEATYKITMYADPFNPVTPNDYFTGGSLGKRKRADGQLEDRRIFVGAVIDKGQTGMRVELLAAEEL